MRLYQSISEVHSAFEPQSVVEGRIPRGVTTPQGQDPTRQLLSMDTSYHTVHGSIICRNNLRHIKGYSRMSRHSIRLVELTTPSFVRDKEAG